MVVVHSPKLRQPGSSASRAPLLDNGIMNTSPLLGVHDGARMLGSSSYASPVNAKSQLDKRLAESLSLVAADSPNSKQNAPWPFASSSRLRRSPPGSAVKGAVVTQPSRLPVAIGQPGVINGSSERQRVYPAPPATQSAQAVPAEQPNTTSASQARNFDVAAKALFDDRRTRPISGRRSSPPPSNLQPAIYMAKNAKPRASLPNATGYHSAALLSTPSQQSHASGSPSRANAGTPLSVQSLAKIGRLSARIAHLESLVTTTQSEAQTWETKYNHAVERYEREKKDREETQAKLDEYVALADACQEILTEYEELKAANTQLQVQHEEDQSSLLTSREAYSKLKWKEKKLKCELATRRQEGKWQELTEHSDELKRLRIAQIDLAVDKVELAMEVACMEAEIAHLQQVAKSAEEELDYIASQRREDMMDSQEHKIRLDLAAEQNAKHHEERTSLISRLDDAIRSREQYEKVNKDLTRQVELLETTDDIVTKEKDGKLRDLKAKLKEVEQKLKISETENGKLDMDKEDLQARLADKEADLALLKSQAKALDKKLKASEEERQNLQTGINMQQRAARAFASPGSSTVRHPSVGPSVSAASVALSAVTASPLGKRKRAPQIVEEEEEQGNSQQAAGSESTGKSSQCRRRKVVREGTEEPETADSVASKEVQELQGKAKECSGRARKGSRQPGDKVAKKTKGQQETILSEDEERLEEDAPKPKRPKKSKAAAEDKESSVEPAPASLAQKDANSKPRRASVRASAKDVTRPKTATGSAVERKRAGSSSISGGKKKLNTLGSIPFSWGSGTSGALTASQIANTVLGLPDILSPVKRQ